jgi:site-specific recombinase
MAQLEKLGVQTQQMSGEALSILRGLLSQIHPKMSLAERVLWFERLMSWLRAKGPIPAAFESSSERGRSARLRLFFYALELDPGMKSHVAALVRSLLTECSPLELLTSTGLPRQNGFFSEASERVMKRLLPRAPRMREMSELVAMAFPYERDAEWIERMPKALAVEIQKLIEFGVDPIQNSWALMRRAFADALSLLAIETAALGLSDAIRDRLPGFDSHESPFLKLNRACEEFTRIMRSRPEHEWIEVAAQQSQEAINRCRTLHATILAQLDHTGVSVNLVFRLEKIAALLDRIESLVFFLAPSTGHLRFEHALGFLAELVRGNVNERSLRALVASNTHLLARKIAESAGASGEHYIARDRDEYNQMVSSAVGGGLVTVFTGALKYVFTHNPLPFFFGGMLNALNYSASFLTIQSMGFTLATKQPSMTAAALAGKLKNLKSHEQMEEFILEVSHLTRSQFGAAFGNIISVVPAAVFFDMVYEMLTHHHFMTAAYAAHTVHGMDPFRSGTVLFAALTGAILWMGSLCSGWLENWAAYRKLPEAIARDPRIVHWLGQERAQRFSKKFLRFMAAVGNCVSLGFMMAWMPYVSELFGFKLEVRHVTLSTGTLALAAASLGRAGMAQVHMGAACFGVFVMLVFNFAVSFALALRVAIRARNVSSSKSRDIIAAIARDFLRHPARYLLPHRKGDPRGPSGSRNTFDNNL